MKAYKILLTTVTTSHQRLYSTMRKT